MRNKQVRDLLPYVVTLVLTVIFAILLSLAVGFSVSQTVLFSVGCVVLVWAAVFTIIQFRRVSTNRVGRPCEESDPDVKRVLIVQPPTGEAEEHHEYHPESPGLDQGQLTAHHIPGCTPLVERAQSHNRR